jgi:hypothetical protein
MMATTSRRQYSVSYTWTASPYSPDNALIHHHHTVALLDDADLQAVSKLLPVGLPRQPRADLPTHSAHLSKLSDAQAHGHEHEKVLMLPLVKTALASGTAGNLNAADAGFGQVFRPQGAGRGWGNVIAAKSQEHEHEQSRGTNCH